MTVTTLGPLAYYAAHGAALFPIPAGQKDPTGIVASWKADYSRDPEQWERWRTAYPGCNFGVVAFASNWIIADADTHASGREAAWAAWCALCKGWGIEPPMPHVQSARGGWHWYFALPEGIDASQLRQPDAVKSLINIRCRGFTVAAGSYYDGTAKGEASGPYILLASEGPIPAPAALIEHCTPRSRPAGVSKVGKWDIDDVRSLYRWIAERDGFAAYEDWIMAGMVAKLEFGDAGADLWAIAHDETVDSDIEASKWDSFSDDATTGGVALGSLLTLARGMGWKGSIRPSTAAMWDGVAQIAAAAGATLHGATAAPSGMPMLAGQAELTSVAEPIISEFLANTSDAPTRPFATEYPTLPESVSGHGLYAPLQDAIARVLALAETPKLWKSTRVADALAILSLVHQDTFEAVCRRIRTIGVPLIESKIKLAATAIADKVERAFVAQDGWVFDPRSGEPQSDNSDNVAIFFAILGLEIRWNAWLERAEVRGGTDPEMRWPTWTYIDDTVTAKLRTRGNRTKTRFKPGKEFFWESILALAHRNPVDPAIEALARLQNEWDGSPRLSMWLSRACGVPCDPYHQAVGRNIIGGAVRRIRQPGCKHDTVAIFHGMQGNLKSTLAATLALDPTWFSDDILLGAESKELVLALAGKSIVELAELNARGTTTSAHVKAMLSRQVDRGRTAYARSVSERPRRNIFIGSTNDSEPLTDPTGNRRFLPVSITQEIDIAWVRENISQIYGEAATLESQGVSFDLPREVWSVAAQHQESARAENDIETMLDDWFALTTHTAKAYIVSADLARLSGLAGWRNGAASASRGAHMKRLGFRPELIRLGDKPRVRAWVRSPDASMGPAEIVKTGARYMVGVDNAHHPTVTIRQETAVSATNNSLPALPRLG